MRKAVKTITIQVDEDGNEISRTEELIPEGPPKKFTLTAHLRVKKKFTIEARTEREAELLLLDLLENKREQLNWRGWKAMVETAEILDYE